MRASPHGPQPTESDRPHRIRDRSARHLATAEVEACRHFCQGVVRFAVRESASASLSDIADSGLQGGGTSVEPFDSARVMVKRFSFGGTSHLGVWMWLQWLIRAFPGFAASTRPFLKANRIVGPVPTLALRFD